MSAARAAFEDMILKHFDHGGLPIDASEVDDPSVAVPGFVALEGRARHRPVRGWANDAGTVVMAPFLNYGPVFDALGVFSGDTEDAGKVAHLIEWASGPTYEVIDAKPTDLGGKGPNAHPASFTRTAKGVEIKFYLRDRDPEEPTICRYVVKGSSADSCRVDIHQLWPKVPDE
jgi:hypothetical protein